MNTNIGKRAIDIKELTIEERYEALKQEYNRLLNKHGETLCILRRIAQELPIPLYADPRELDGYLLAIAVLKERSRHE